MCKNRIDDHRINKNNFITLNITYHILIPYLQNHIQYASLQNI